jgi:hypothetical protein
MPQEEGEIEWQVSNSYRCGHKAGKDGPPGMGLKKLVVPGIERGMEQLFDSGKIDRSIFRGRVISMDSECRCRCQS